MAERRMFAKTIIDSDAFLDMPLSTQALYFHLSMRADDEGFINNPKKIQRMIGAADDDLKVLEAKNFIIPFESGIVVIKHWRIHNYIRADRMVETKYEEERQMLKIKDNGAYTIENEINEIEMIREEDPRKQAYKDSSLPYSFSYKMKRAFEGQICPICGKTMTSAYRNCLPTIQHNIPISKGGLHELDNISVICSACNTSTQDNETGNLNNNDVIDIWDKIVYLDNLKIKWFDNPKILWQADVRHLSDTCQADVSIGKDSIGKDSIGKDREGKSRAFTPPSLDDVRGYCDERNNGIDPQMFIDFYESKGWMVGKNKMKNWKAAVRTWEQRDKDQVVKKPKTQDYEQRQYSDADYLEFERKKLGIGG